MLSSAMGTTIQRIGCFHTMSDDTASTMGTGGRQSMDGAFETVKYVQFSSHPHLKTLIIDIATNFARTCPDTQVTFTFIHT
jgi:hypothetical protein